MQIKAIAAVARNGVIGDNGSIPWELPADWRRFRQITTTHTLVMGRQTFEGIGRPLPQRTTIVVTRDHDWTPPAISEAPVDDPAFRTRVLVAHSVEQAIEIARRENRERTCWIAGGGEIYREAMPLITGMDISEVDAEPAGDTFFPEISADQWRALFREPAEGFDVAHYAPVVRTQRLLLEPVSVDDTDDWNRLHLDRSLYRTRASEVEFRGAEEVDQILAQQITSWVETGVGYWIAREPETREPVGLGGIRRRTEGDDTFWNLYYRLPEASQGKGYAAEISRAAFQQLARLDPVAEVRAIIRPGNHESEGVARRLGMFQMGELVDGFGHPGKIYTGLVPQLLMR